MRPSNGLRIGLLCLPLVALALEPASRAQLGDLGEQETTKNCELDVRAAANQEAQIYWTEYDRNVAGEYERGVKVEVLVPRGGLLRLGDHDGTPVDIPTLLPGGDMQAGLVHTVLLYWSTADGKYRLDVTGAPPGGTGASVTQEYTTSQYAGSYNALSTVVPVSLLKVRYGSHSMTDPTAKQRFRVVVENFGIQSSFTLMDQ